MPRLAVLGANSFAGAGVVDLALQRGYEVLGISRSPEKPDFFLPYKGNPRAAAYRFLQLDLNHDMERVQRALDEFAPEFVVDLAGQAMVAESWAHPDQWYRTNILAKVILHDFLRQRPWLRRYVKGSTPEVYGSTGGLVGEDRPYAPSTPYAVSHAAIDLSLLAFFRQYGFPVVFTRFANFYGPGQQLYRIVPRTILCALCGKKLPLHGGGGSVRAFIHVRDVAEGMLAALDRGQPGEIYHFSPADFHSIREVVEMICAELRMPFAQVAAPAPERPGKDQAYLMSAERARKELDWEPRVPFPEGIRDTIRWVERHLEDLRRLPWDYEHKA